MHLSASLETVVIVLQVSVCFLTGLANWVTSSRSIGQLVQADCRLTSKDSGRKHRIMFLPYSHLQPDLPENGWDGSKQWGGDGIAGACSVPDMYHLQQQQPCHGPCVGPAYQDIQPTMMYMASNPMGQMDNAQHAFQQLQGFQGCGMMGESVPMSEPNLSFGQSTWHGEGTSWYDPSLEHLIPNGQDHLSNQPSKIQDQDEDTVDPLGLLLAELKPSQPTSWKETKCDEVDEDFERDVTNAVAMFLQGNDIDLESEDDVEVDDSATWETGPTRAPAREVPKTDVPQGDEKPMENVHRDPQLLSLICQFAKRLQQLGHDPDSNMPSEMPAAGTGSMESMPQFPETLHAGVLKLFENMTSSQVQESPAPFFPMPGAQLAPASREALPKASLQLEHLVCNPSGRRSPIGPELQRGQCIGVLLKMKRLPPGVTAAHLAVLRPHVTWFCICHLISLGKQDFPLIYEYCTNPLSGRLFCVFQSASANPR